MRLEVVTNQGERVETIVVDGYDLTKTMARAAIMNEIEAAVERGKKIEKTFGIYQNQN